MNGILTFTLNGEPHIEIEERHGRAIEAAYQQGVKDALAGTPRPPARPPRTSKRKKP